MADRNLFQGQSPPSRNSRMSTVHTSNPGASAISLGPQLTASPASFPGPLDLPQPISVQDESLSSCSMSPVLAGWEHGQGRIRQTWSPVLQAHPSSNEPLPSQGRKILGLRSPRASSLRVEVVGKFSLIWESQGMALIWRERGRTWRERLPSGKGSSHLKWEKISPGSRSQDNLT